MEAHFWLDLVGDISRKGNMCSKNPLIGGFQWGVMFGDHPVLFK
jgi:hypothetical protein